MGRMCRWGQTGGGREESGAGFGELTKGGVINSLITATIQSYLFNLQIDYIWNSDKVCFSSTPKTGDVPKHPQATRVTVVWNTARNQCIKNGAKWTPLVFFGPATFLCKSNLGRIWPSSLHKPDTCTWARWRSSLVWIALARQHLGALRHIQCFTEC